MGMVCRKSKIFVNNSTVMVFLDLHLRIQELLNEKEKIQEEFNIQRARLKELFLQKEGTCQTIFFLKNY